MKTLIKLISLSLFLCGTVHAQVKNGSFENWNGNVPEQWTTRDSGIALARTSSQKTNAQYAARVTVNTRSQGNTDLAQRINVVAGETYRFRTNVYHTEGRVRARLLVDGFRGYSDPSRRNQWQTIEYSYTATQSKEISIGLRFYDISGFDGSEVVYVDYFRPLAQVAPPVPSCAGSEATITVRSDNYGAETAWQLFDSANQVIGGDSNFANNITRSKAFCLSDGEYHFTITDTFGDGICCQFGNGLYTIEVSEQEIKRGGDFRNSDSHTFTIGGGVDEGDYYQAANGLSGFPLKTALHNIIKGHAVQGYGALWGFYSANELDLYYENDGSILDIYSENPSSAEAYNYTPVSNQCGSFRNEGDCYNREHSFPRSWFGGAIEPMNSDVHHIFASDGKVNSTRSSWPYGEISNATTTTSNGSKQGLARTGLGYTGDVFEPIDEFKGDIARAQFYIATRYENIVAGWQSNNERVDAVLNGNNTSVFEPWYLDMLKRWHQQDPVSQKERDRNDAALIYQGNRNPFVDHPEYVNRIWGN